MRAFLSRWFGWLGVPQPPSPAAIDEDGPVPNGLYAVPDGHVIVHWQR